MRKNNIVKVVMSAAAAAYVVVMPVQAEEKGEETVIREWGDTHGGPQPDDCGQMTDMTMSDGSAIDEDTENSHTANENAVYEPVSHTECSEEEISREDTADYQEEIIQTAEAIDSPAEDSQVRTGRGPGKICLRSTSIGPGYEEEQVSDLPEISPVLDEEDETQEAEYSALGAISGGEIKEISSGMLDMEDLIRKTGFGPHLILYMKQEEEKEEAESESEPAAPAYSEEDLYILAHAICGEGQGYPDDEQLYIGSVILNRRADGAFPDTIKGVVFQKGQYACTRDGNYYREPTEANWRNARWLLENGSVLPGNVVYQARFRQGSGLYVQTRYHKYCYR